MADGEPVTAGAATGGELPPPDPDAMALIKAQGYFAMDLPISEGMKIGLSVLLVSFVSMALATRCGLGIGAGVWSGAPALVAVGVRRTDYSSSSSSSRASHVASRSTGTSKSGLRSTNVRSCSASHSKVTSSWPRRFSSSSMPRSVKYNSRS